jgi:hypothetical protein
VEAVMPSLRGSPLRPTPVRVGGGGAVGASPVDRRSSGCQRRRLDRIRRGDQSPTRCSSPVRIGGSGTSIPRRDPLRNRAALTGAGDRRWVPPVRNPTVVGNVGVAGFEMPCSRMDKKELVAASDHNLLTKSRVPPVSRTLVWVRKDLVQSKSFTPADCHPSGAGFLPKPRVIKFSELW